MITKKKYIYINKTEKVPAECQPINHGCNKYISHSINELHIEKIIISDNTAD